jgi:hypothetical protein
VRRSKLNFRPIALKVKGLVQCNLTY